ERMTVARHVGGEDADLAVRDLASGTSVLPHHPARRLALLEKAGLVDHQHRNPCDPGSPVAAKDRDRQRPPRASNRSCVAHLRVGFPETSLHSSQHDLDLTTEGSVSLSPEE